MKMDSMNISLPQPMAEYIRGVVDREYGNTSEYIRDLVREKMRAEIEADVKFLEKCMAGAPAGPSEADIKKVLAIQKQVRKEMRAGRL